MQQLDDMPEAEECDTYIFAYRTIYHEFRGDGWHRLRINDRAYKRGGSWVTTEWTPYDEIIIVPEPGVPDYRASSICATTEYWENHLPRVFRTEAAERLP